MLRGGCSAETQVHPAQRSERYAWIETVLTQQQYFSLGKKHSDRLSRISRHTDLIPSKRLRLGSSTGAKSSRGSDPAIKRAADPPAQPEFGDQCARCQTRRPTVWSNSKFPARVLASQQAGCPKRMSRRAIPEAGGCTPMMRR